MAKYFYIPSILGSLLLLFAAGYLIWVNRSPKVVLPMIGALAAITTTALTIWIQLKSETRSDRFVYSVVTRAVDGLPAQMELSPDWRMSQRGMLIAKASNEPVAGKANTVRPRTAPLARGEERTTFYLDLLQLELFSQIYSLLNTDFEISSTVNQQGAFAASEVREPPRTAGFCRVPCSTLIAQLTGNRFVTENEARFWNDPRVTMALPPGTVLSFPNGRTLQIERPDFYRITIRVEPGAGASGVPQFLASLIKEPHAETHAFIVRMDATFKRLAAENPDMIEAKVWTDKVFAALKRSMADPQS